MLGILTVQHSDLVVGEHYRSCRAMIETRMIVLRICPGRHFSDTSLYAIASSILAVYDITQPLDANGSTIKLEAEVTSGLTS